MSERRFEVPNRLMTDGYIKTISRDTLVMLLTGAYGIENEIEEGTLIPSVAAVSKFTGLTTAEIKTASREAFVITGCIILADGPEPDGEPEPSPRVKAILEQAKKEKSE